MTDKPLGIDISRHQGIIDFTKMQAQNVRWVYLRCGISYGYEDVMFQANRQACEEIGLPWGAYHAVYCGQGAQKHANNIIEIMGDNWGQLPFAIDMEVALEQKPTLITSELLELAGIIESKSKRKPIIYSRANWINYYTINGTWRKEYQWWLAQYLQSGVEHPGNPVLPAGVTRDQVIIHQTSEKGNGKLYGVQSASIDLNRWQLSEEALQAFIGSANNVPEPSDAEKLARLWQAHPELWK